MNIGKLQLQNNLFMAPMSGITDLGFRTIAREFGASLCFTEMISAAGLVKETVKSYRYLQSVPSDRPLGIQIFGSDSDILAEGAKIAEEAKADLIDINMGCPARKVLKNGAGGSLMRNPSRVAEIVKKVRRAVDIPLTIKIRSGWSEDEVTAVEIAHIAEDCGANALILHPRTVRQGFSGQADWNLIGTVKKRLRIPVIGSGDIRVADDGLRMIALTGCDAVMVGRGALGNPWIFKTMVNMFKNGRGTKAPSLRERQKIIENHLEMTIGIYGESLGIKNFRKHLAWYTKGLRGSSQFRQAAFHITVKDSLIESVHRYVQSLDNSDVKILDKKDK
ncbi:MAG: tRNA dihydrouridine synthase DusB [Deltaproteobacteria bacterium]|nr:tRNA dihydrouridine synthase DusB [Deltaproteobacteria bacterium]